jgi:predicted nucleic acid-binding protein
VSQIVLLDAGPLGLLSNPARSAEVLACNQWLVALVAAGCRVIVPEIADYEVRRELLRAGKTPGIARLDALAQRLEYLPLTTAAMRQAALFWAQARQQGRPTAPDNALDGDVILAAQAVTLAGSGTIVATTNPGHPARFTLAELWMNITRVPCYGITSTFVALLSLFLSAAWNA